MPWAKIDGSFSMHPKVLTAGNSATGCYARALAYCAEHLTDGYLTERIAAVLGTEEDHEALTEVELWKRVRAGEAFTVTDRADSGRRKLPDVTVTIPGAGFFIPDFLHYSGTKAEHDALRASRQRAGQKGGKQAPAQADAQSDAQAPAVAPEQASELSSRPVPSRSKNPPPNPTSDVDPARTTTNAERAGGLERINPLEALEAAERARRASVRAGGAS